MWGNSAPEGKRGHVVYRVTVLLNFEYILNTSTAGNIAESIEDDNATLRDCMALHASVMDVGQYKLA